MDVYGDSEKFGEQVGGDVISNKKTYLLIKVLELAKGEDLNILNQWLSLKTFNAEEKVMAVRTIYDRIGIRKLSDKAMQSYANVVLAEFELIKVSDGNKEVLMEFAELLVGREH